MSTSTFIKTNSKQKQILNNNNQISFRFDLYFVWKSLNMSYSELWTPYGHVALDDKANAWKGRSVYRIYRLRKPFPWAKLEYVIVDQYGWIVAFIPRFGDFATITPKYQAWKSKYEDFKKNATAKPLPFKTLYPRTSKTKFDLEKAINFLLSRLPDRETRRPAEFIDKPTQLQDWSKYIARDLSHYHVFSDREFSPYWQLYQQYKIGYTVGIVGSTFTYLFRDNMALNLKPGNWNSLTNGSHIVMSYYDPQGSICHWASNCGTSSAIHEITKSKNKKKKLNYAAPHLVQQYRTYFASVDKHNSKAKKFVWPFRTRKVTERYVFGDWEHSAQVQAETLFKMLTGKKDISAKQFLASLARQLAADFKTKRKNNLTLEALDLVRTAGKHNPYTHVCAYEFGNTKRCFYCQINQVSSSTL